MRDSLTDRIDRIAAWWSRNDTVLYALFAMACTIYTATLFYSYLLFQTRGVWSAPLDDVFIHFDYARSFARGFPFHWSEGNGYSSGNTSLTYPIALALGYWMGFRGLSIMVWAATLATVSILIFLLGAGALVAPREDSGAPSSMRWARFLIPPAVLSMGALDWTLFSGMENAFHLGIWGIFIGFAIRQTRSRDAKTAVRRAWVAGIAGAVLVATRPESGICVAAVAFYCAWSIRSHGVDKGWRSLLHVIVAIGTPGVLFLLGHAGFNYAFTGEWSANGSIAKLFMNNPFMTSAEKWERYQFLLNYIVPRVLFHHFSDTWWISYLILFVAATPLASRRLRPVAILLWVQVVIWILTVSLNNQVRWHNERYAMPAVAWTMVLAAMGVATIGGARLHKRIRLLPWLQRPRAATGVWVGRAAIAVGLCIVYWIGQAPKHKDQVWFFGRASRNILDQHVTAGLVLKKLEARRVLVGDAGALTYASDRPGLDLIGLGGYHAYPFARSTVNGLGASLELIERIPASERPDYMAIYPSWWGDMPLFFGDLVTKVPVHGNVICGGANKVLYEAEWRGFDRRGQPRSILDGERVVDQVDVADLLSERRHSYNFPTPGIGFVQYHLLPDPADYRRDLFDAGRLIPPGQTETVRITAPTGKARLIVRVANHRPVDTEVRIDDRVVGTLFTDKVDAGWQELAVSLPDDRPREFLLGLAPKQHATSTFHIWVVLQ